MQSSTLALAGLALPASLAAGAPPAGSSGTLPAPSAGPFVLPPLSYAYEALEPAIDAETMRLHHDKHHATYVAKLNEAVAAAPELAGKSVEELLRDLARVPEAVRTAIRNHGGGHANHSLFWTSLRPGGASAPSGRLAESIAAQFGTIAGLSEQLTKAAMGVFGSGWAWLVLDGRHRLSIAALPNQDSPLSSGETPLLGLDVWEHAYYLKYQNRRADYVQALLGVVDWAAVSKRYEESTRTA